MMDNDSHESLGESYDNYSARGSSVGSSYSSGGISEGPMAREMRNKKIKKYWEKKRQRKSQKFVRYECRKNLAEKR